MAFSNGPAVTRSGLVLCLDAADRLSYPGSGTTWSDVSGNSNNGTLTNGPTFNAANGGAIVFDGTDDLVSVSNNTTLNSNIGTISVWFNYTSAPGDGSIIIGKTDVIGSYNGFNIFIYNNTIAAQVKGPLLTTNVIASGISTNTWYNYVLAYSSGVSYSVYLNGVNLESGSLVSFTMSTQPLRIARSVDSYWTIYGGRVSTVQMYNRILSASEVLQNYNALKSRFGLT